MYNSVKYGTRQWWIFECISVNMHWRSLIKRGSHMAEEFILSTRRSYLTAHEFSSSYRSFQLNITTNLPYKIKLLFCLVETVSTWTCVEKYEKNTSTKNCLHKKNQTITQCYVECFRIKFEYTVHLRFFLSEFGQFWVCFYQKWLKMQKKDVDIQIFRIS